jgi:hypothetical protein
LDLDGGEDGVINGSAVRLDGEWPASASAFPSGDGAAGGDFRFRLNALAADVNRDGRVNTFDWLELRRRYGRSTASPGPAGSTLSYTAFHDVNGDGVLNAQDLVMVRRNLLRSLPAGQPAAPAAPPPAAPALQTATEDLFSTTPVLGA